MDRLPLFLVPLFVAVAMSGCLANLWGPPGPQYELSGELDDVPDGLVPLDPQESVPPTGQWVLEAHLDGWLWYAQRIGSGEPTAEFPYWGLEFTPDDDSIDVENPLLLVTDPSITPVRYGSFDAPFAQVRHDPFDRDTVEHAQAIFAYGEGGDEDDGERFLFGYIASNVPGTVRLFLELGGDEWHRFEPITNGADPLVIEEHELTAGQPLRIENQTIGSGLAMYLFPEAPGRYPAERNVTIGYEEHYHEIQEGRLEESWSDTYYSSYGWLDHPGGLFRLQVDYDGPEKTQPVWVLTQHNTVDADFDAMFGYRTFLSISGPLADGELTDSRPR